MRRCSEGNGGGVLELSLDLDMRRIERIQSALMLLQLLTQGSLSVQ